MDCWTDNIMCDAVQCVGPCWTKFFDPKQTPNCIACDEKRCGPEFIKCAGANRRSSGIISDIERDIKTVCRDGAFSHTHEEDLPTWSGYSKKEILKIITQTKKGV